MSAAPITSGSGFEPAGVSTGQTRDRIVLTLVGAVMFALFIATNLPWQLDDYDQAKQAFTSFEMVKEGHWIYQRTPHERVATKPPLVGWVSAFTYEITRSWALAWRLPSIAAAVALAWLLWRAGNSYGATAGVISLSAFAFNLLTPRLASLVRTDMPLALAIGAVGLMIWRHLRAQQPWTTRDRLWLFALLTAGMLIKGPIVYAFLLPGIIILAVIRLRTVPTRPVDRRYDYAWPGWWPWAGSLGVFVLWVAGGWLNVPGFYDQVVVREFLGRFGETIHRPQPIYFYIPHLLHKFAPWSIWLLVVSVMAGYRLVRSQSAAAAEPLRPAPCMTPDMLWLICWSLGGLILMSVVPSKRVDRIFPVIPPFCLMIGALFGDAEALGRSRQWMRAMVVVAVLYATGYAAFKVYTGYRDHRDALVKFGKSVREQATTHHWRYEVADASDEGLLLYCDRLHFLSWPEAVAEWKERRIDALVAPEDSSWGSLLGLPGDRYATPPPAEQRRNARNYVLLMH